MSKYYISNEHTSRNEHAGTWLCVDSMLIGNVTQFSKVVLLIFIPAGNI